jgi:hypothetical protein
MKDDSMNKAYRVAHELLRQRLRQSAPDRLADLDEITDADVLVTRGEYDHIESVFQYSGTPFTLIDPEDLDQARLRPDQILFVNCPGKFTPAALRKLTSFVEQGGFLFTTDWALKHVLEPAFPGLVEYNQRPTGDEVVRIEILDRQDPFLNSILDENDDPQWWLEGSSYPIRILDPGRVRVLIQSKQIAERHGEAPVFITFEYGQGKVYHMISHFYLQRTETRTARHAAPSSTYLQSKGVRPAEMPRFYQMGAEELSTGEVESALTSQVMMQSILSERHRRNRRRRVQGRADEPKEG